MATRTSFGSAQFAQLEMAGSWLIGQLTATRWQWEAERFRDALPRTLAMLGAGTLLVHQATVLLHRTRHCTPEVARAVEAAVLPQGAELVPADLTRRVDRTVLQVESEQLDSAAAEQRHADPAAQRATFTKATQDGSFAAAGGGSDVQGPAATGSVPGAGDAVSAGLRAWTCSRSSSPRRS